MIKQCCRLAFSVVSVGAICTTGALAQETSNNIGVENGAVWANEISVDFDAIPPPGGYMSGFTKPLAADVSVRFWGPGIITPQPGGAFSANLGISRAPSAQKSSSPKSAKINRGKRKKQPSGEVTVWTDVSGKHAIQASFERLSDERVHLVKPDGKKISIAIKDLSRESLLKAMERSQSSK